MCIIVFLMCVVGDLSYRQTSKRFSDQPYLFEGIFDTQRVRGLVVENVT